MDIIGRSCIGCIYDDEKMKAIILGILFVMMVGMVYGYNMDWTIPATAETSSDFNIDLTVTGASGNYGVLYTIDVTGGCTSAAGNTHIAGGFVSETDKTVSINMIAADTAGTCTFTGEYGFADAGGQLPKENFNETTMTVTSGPGCTPVWVCGSWSTCSASCTRTRTCTDSACGEDPITESEACSGGACDSTDTCGELGGDICLASENCVGGTIVQSSDSTRCCVGGTCSAPSPEDLCEVWEEYDSAAGTCKIAGWVILVAGFFGLMMMLKVVTSR